MAQIIWDPADSSDGLKSSYYKYVATQYSLEAFCHCTI